MPTADDYPPAQTLADWLDEDPHPRPETVQERAARGEPDAVARMAVLAQVEAPVPEARTLMGRPFARPEGADEKPDIRKPGMGEISTAAVEALNPLTSPEGLPPLPRRLIAAKLRDDARVALQDAPRKLRAMADVADEADSGGSDLTYEIPERGNDDDWPGRDDFRRWADAIEALLR